MFSHIVLFLVWIQKQYKVGYDIKWTNYVMTDYIRGIKYAKGERLLKRCDFSF